MDYVLDCSIVMTWCFADEATAATDKLLDTFPADRAIVPRNWKLEVLNSLVSGERRNRITAEEADDFIDLVNSFPLRLDRARGAKLDRDILNLCRQHRLTAYDAAYLELAIRRHLPLATLDIELRVAAEKEGVPLLGKE
jgi:predicted nucleic acid-binding protein